MTIGVLLFWSAANLVDNLFPRIWGILKENRRCKFITAGLISNEKKIAEKLSPEQALRLLNDKLDFGMITEEEYQAQRNEIISKL